VEPVQRARHPTTSTSRRVPERQAGRSQFLCECSGHRPGDTRPRVIGFRRRRRYVPCKAEATAAPRKRPAERLVVGLVRLHNGRRASPAVDQRGPRIRLIDAFSTARRFTLWDTPCARYVPNQSGFESTSAQGLCARPRRLPGGDRKSVEGS
jgi:hypothetical protein